MVSDGERRGCSAEDADPVFLKISERFLKISELLSDTLCPSGGRIVFASRIPSRPLRLGGLGSGAWRLGDLGALFLLLGRLPRSYLHLAWMALKCSTVVKFWPGWP